MSGHIYTINNEGPELPRWLKPFRVAPLKGPLLVL